MTTITLTIQHDHALSAVEAALAAESAARKQSAAVKCRASINGAVLVTAEQHSHRIGGAA